MTEAEEVPASYTEAGPGVYSTEEHLKAQQEQTSPSNDLPLHPELDPDAPADDPAVVGSTPPAPADSAPADADTGKHEKGSV